MKSVWRIVKRHRRHAGASFLIQRQVLGLFWITVDTAYSEYAAERDLETAQREYFRSKMPIPADEIVYTCEVKYD